MPGPPNGTSICWMLRWNLKKPSSLGEYNLMYQGEHEEGCFVKRVTPPHVKLLDLLDLNIRSERGGVLRLRLDMGKLGTHRIGTSKSERDPR